MFDPIPQSLATRTAGTEKRYMIVGWNRLRAYANDSNISPLSVRPVLFVEWLIEQQPSWKKSTWRHYKAAVAYLLQNFYPQETEALELLQSGTQSRCKRVGRSTSDKKHKSFPPNCLEAILAHLATSHSQYSPPLSVFLQAAVLTGLRPTEWFGAHIQTDDEGTKLYVINAKQTNKRANGYHRSLNLNEFNEKNTSIIRTWIGVVNDLPSKKSFDDLITSMSAVLRRVNLTLWPKSELRYTLYSGRHQASANWKTHYRPAEVAALLGHAIDDTAVKHYGRASRGTNMLLPNTALALPIPSPAEVQRVRTGRAFKPKLGAEIEGGMNPFDDGNNNQDSTGLYGWPTPSP